MALYRINQRNVLFRGFVGDFVSAAPDPLLDAAVKSGVLSRMDAELPVLVEEPPKAEPVEVELWADKEIPVIVRMSDVEPTKKKRGK